MNPTAPLKETELRTDIIEHFEQFVKLPEQLKRELEKRLNLALFKKGEMVLDARRVYTERYFMTSGFFGCIS